MTEERKDMERRRFSAARDLDGGMRQSDVARKYDVSRTTASRWAHLVKNNESLFARKPPGRPFRIEPDALREIILECPKGMTNEVTAKVIKDVTGVRYDPDHVGRLRHRFGHRRRRAAAMG
jgi:transposase